MNILYVTGGESTVQLVSGESKPRLQGWISQGYAQLTPSQALGIHLKRQGCEFWHAFLYRRSGIHVVPQIQWAVLA